MRGVFTLRKRLAAAQLLRLAGVFSLVLGCSGVVRQGSAETNDGPCAPDGSVTTDAKQAKASSEPAAPQQPSDASSPSPTTSLGACDPSGWRVVASSSAPGASPANAVDGVPSTHWSTAAGQGPGEYLQISFGGWLTLSRLALASGGGGVSDYLRGYEILASKDGISFDTLLASGTQALPPQAGIQIIDFFSTPLQALRINSIQPSGNGWSVNELNVDCYGTDSRYGDDLLCDSGSAGAAAVGEDSLDRASWSATAARSEDAKRASAAFDGDLATSWSTGAPQSPTDWFQLDLGKVTCISTLSMLMPEGEAANAYTVEVSQDASHYVQVAEGLGDDGSDIHFAPHAARFIRINQIGSGASNRWSIREIRV